MRALHTFEVCSGHIFASPCLLLLILSFKSVYAGSSECSGDLMCCLLFQVHAAASDGCSHALTLYIVLTGRVFDMMQASSDNIGEVREAAANAVAEYAKFSDVFQFDLADSPAIRQLEGDDQFDNLHQLLHLLLDGDVKASYRWVSLLPTKYLASHKI